MLCVYKARVELHYVTQSTHGNYVMLYGENFGRRRSLTYEKGLGSPPLFLGQGCMHLHHHFVKHIHVPQIPESHYNLHFFCYCSYGYAPYTILKKCGIKGPIPRAIVGNLEFQKGLVSFYIHNLHLTLTIAPTSCCYRDKPILFHSGYV